MAPSDVPSVSVLVEDMVRSDIVEARVLVVEVDASDAAESPDWLPAACAMLPEALIDMCSSDFGQ